MLFPQLASADAIEFKPAYHKDFHKPVKTQDGHPAIQFDSFVAVDWNALARKYFTEYPTAADRISKNQLKVLQKISFFGYSSVSFTAPAPQAVANQKLVFMSSDGSREIVAKELKGIVRYKFNRSQDRIISVDFFGYVLGAPKPNNIHSGGFVALLPKDKKLIRERLVNLEAETLVQINPYPKLNIKRQTQYEFGGSESSYWVLEYGSDPDCEYGCCEHRYLLFERQKGGGHFKQLAACEYECDV